MDHQPSTWERRKVSRPILAQHAASPRSTCVLQAGESVSVRDLDGAGADSLVECRRAGADTVWALAQDLRERTALAERDPCLEVFAAVACATSTLTLYLEGVGEDLAAKNLREVENSAKSTPEFLMLQFSAARVAMVGELGHAVRAIANLEAATCLARAWTGDESDSALQWALDRVAQANVEIADGQRVQEELRKAGRFQKVRR